MALPLAALWGAPAHAAGGHWLVDDAAIVPPGRPALELWFERFDDGDNAVVAQPAYTLRAGIEVTLVVENVSGNGGRDTGFGLEGKGLWYDFETGDPLGFGWVLGTAHDSGGALEAFFGYLPLTLPLHEDGWLLHVNLGWEADHSGPSNEGNAFFGAGSQLAIGGAVELITELQINTDAVNLAQAGFRFELADAPAVIDISYGRELERGSSGWTTLGFAWEF